VLFPAMKGQQSIRKQLYDKISSQYDFHFFSDSHPEHSALVFETIINSYIIMRMHYYLKFENRKLQVSITGFGYRKLQKIKNI
jgi:hypothetical protein